MKVLFDFSTLDSEAKAKMVTAAGSLAQIKAMAPNHRRRQHNHHTLVVIKTKQKLPVSLKS